ncbi:MULTISPECIES: nitrate- and nitrite sensing domain-containing protein [unclassified Streptomyces]|uniref:sensor histidine kinase n=1 Tax=unclassified Streptomyces TaxID=2593676 RepID=UPI002E0E21AE|nr:nitrate- and nitrite sensing domain-containing protein [Streptomyces sp. NBC_01197]WSS51909.1 nitrate- and nitrite sensing domain-containing protein [Streptomyces sp. NBC_01180]
MQGRFKRDGTGSPQARQGQGEAEAEQEPRGGSDRGSSAQHAQAPRGHSQTPASGGESSTSARPSAPAAPKTKGQTGAGSRIALRNWRISTRLVSLLALPVVAATTLGGLRINDSLDNMQQLDHMQLLTQMTKQATELAAALQEERDRSAGPLSHGAKADDFNVEEPRKRTDLADQAFLKGTADFDKANRDSSIESIRGSLRGIATKLTRLKAIRADAYQGSATTSQTVNEYSELIDSLLGLSQDMAQATANPEMIKRTRALAAFSSAKEYASIQRAVIAAALPTSNKGHGQLEESDRLFAKSAMQSEEDELKSFKLVYAGNAAALTAPLDTGNPEITAASLYAKHVLENKGGLESQTPRSYKDWYDADSNRITAMKTIEATLLGEMEQKARELRNDAEREAIINAALIVLVLGVSLVGAFVVARSMIRSLRRLQDTATKVASERLPELVKQLSETDPQDVDTSVESVGVHSRDEIGKVATAFDDVHREAVRLASEQAMLRGNVNAMFTNLSRRSQGLIQRQLSLISELESREADPDQLSSLFKLDHLATRMRRNGENLLVLAGEEPGRRWTRPVPLVDVLRAAASEVEQYERIELAAVPATEVAGRVVNDLVHLLAELLENATSFSSPQTKVRVTGHALPDGRVLVEIHDTGIGLSPEDLAAINERLASPPTVDVSVSRRMGLFVVGRLSLRHGIRIQLRPSDSGGTTALVMLPVDVAQGGKKAPAKPGVPGGQQPPQQQLGQSQQGAGAPGRAGAGAGAPAGAGIGAGAPRGQVSGTGPRAALPARDGDRSIQPGGPQQQGQPQGGSAPAPAVNAFGAGAPMPRRAAQGGRGGQGGQGDAPGRGGNGPQRPQQPGDSMFQPPADRQQQPGDSMFQPPADRQQQLPPTGGPRAELPGGNPGGPQTRGPQSQQPQGPQPPQRPQTTSWGNELPQRAAQDMPRGHEEPDTGAFPDAFGPGTSDSGAAGTGNSGAQYRQPLRPRRQSGERAPADDLFGSDRLSADRQGPGSTAEFQRPDFDGPPPGSTGRFERADVFERPDVRGPQRRPQIPQVPQIPQAQQQDGRFQQGRPQDELFQQDLPYQDPQQSQDPASTAQFPRAGLSDFGGFDSPRPPAPSQGPGGAPQQRDRTEADFGAPRPPAPQSLPAQPQYDALPPAAGPGDGRTPLYDTLETNWFHGAQSARTAQPQGPAAPQQPEQAAPAAPPRDPMAQTAPGSNWRASPNDELVRQAERAKKPAAGGVTTSGLPRRVPRANLVPGTAQQQAHQAGPQVSRAPDDVRGRLTNLRRGIQQGRQAGTGPSHQQEH